jgi:hypothetical protein
VFYAVGYASSHHIDPFDWPALWRVEQLLYNGGIGHAKPFQFAPYADVPPWEILLRSLTIVTESVAYRVWAAALLIMAGIGGFLILREWPLRRRLFGSTVVALCPAALFDIRVGQDSLPQVFFFGLGIYLINRKLPFVAGLALAGGCYKPHLALPVALIVTLWSGPANAKRVVAGLALGCATYIGFGLLFDGGFTTYAHWIGSVHKFGSSIGQQPDLASIPGLYLGRAGTTVSWALNTASILVATLTILVLHASTSKATPADRLGLLGGGIATYLALSPYVHTTDQVLLTIPLLLLIGSNGAGLRDTATLLAGVVAMLAPLVVLTDYHTTGINALPPVCVALAFLLRTRDSVPALAGGADLRSAPSVPAIGVARG